MEVGDLGTVGRRGHEDFAAIGENHLAGRRDAGAVARTVTDHGHALAGFYQLAGPALTLERVRSGGFTGPVRKFAVRAHVDVKVHVRIHPFDFRDAAFESNSFAQVEFGADGMMRVRRSGGQREREQHRANRLGQNGASGMHILP